MEDPRAVLMAQETRIDLEETEINQDLPDVDANAPPRNGGPQNDCRERSPPAFPEMTQSHLEENVTELEPEQPFIEPPPVEQSVEPVERPEVEIPEVIVEPPVDEPPLNEPPVDEPPVEPLQIDEPQPLNDPQPISGSQEEQQVDGKRSMDEILLESLEEDQAPKKKRKKEPKRKNRRLIIDIEPQISMDQMHLQRQDYSDLILTKQLPLGSSDVRILLETRIFKADIMAKDLKKTLRTAAFDKKYDSEDEDDQMEIEVNPQPEGK